MRRLDVIVLAVFLMSAATGCSRLTFVKPTSKRVPIPEHRSEYSVGDSAATKQRLAVEDRLALAAQRLRSGDLATAEREAKTVLKSNPDSADAYTLLAVVQDQQGKVAQAGDYYKRAAELAPARGEALNNYGAWLCANGHPAEALVWFDRALNAPGYSTPASALANAGGCALSAGQYERSGRDLRNALGLDPGNAYALASMAESEYRQGRYFEARAFTERRLAAAPANPAVLQLASNIEERLGDKAAASRYVQRLRAEFPDSITANPGETTKP
ncbi:MAG TPA: type IV pilus biogenesis/stability protein PilW [Pseudoxanthomonas sp.]|nr:type IV pilus biogenesis/stability protein PilW [Pseudoxanthomonas sp.]